MHTPNTRLQRKPQRPDHEETLLSRSVDALLPASPAHSADTAVLPPAGPALDFSLEQINTTPESANAAQDSDRLAGLVAQRPDLLARDTDAAPTGPPANPFVLQASLRVNAPDDAYEVEADRVAAMVMRQPADAPVAPPSFSPLAVQRSADAGVAVTPDIEAGVAELAGGGAPLPASEQAFFSEHMGADFSNVRIHQTPDLAQSLDARAFTVGSDIAFDAGEYQPGTDAGRELLAHELTHVVQQTGGIATKRIQRQPSEADEDPAEEVALEEPEAASAEPATLVAEVAQSLSEAEVAQQQVPSVQGEEVTLPEAEIAAEADAGGGGGGAVAEPAPADAHPAAEALQQAATTALTAAGIPGAATLAATLVDAPEDAVSAPASAVAPDAAPTPEAPETDADAPQPIAPTPDPAAAAPQPAAPSAEPASAAAGPQGVAEEHPAADARAEGRPRDPDAEEEQDDVRADTPAVQRMPAGRVIQRTPAARPSSPADDPAFQAVTGSVKGVAVSQKQHAPAKQKADEAAAAAKMPGEEKLGAAQNTQAVTVDAAAEAQAAKAQGGEAPGFDKAAFVAAVRARIDELTPSDPKQMEDIEGSGVFTDAKAAVDEKVQGGKQQAQGTVDDKIKEAPNPDAVPDKPTTPLQPNRPGTAPGQLDASGAAPKPADPAAVEAPLQTESAALDAKMADARVTEDQLQQSNEPSFTGALQAKTDAQTHVPQATGAYRQGEQAQIGTAQAAAGTLTQEGAAAMFGGRSEVLREMDGLQQGAQQQDEGKRAEIGRAIDGIYGRTKTEVEGILAALDTAVDQTFSSGADRAKAAAIDYIKRETDAYKAERYGDNGGIGDKIGGLWNRVDDTFTGMPEEYYEYYRQGRDRYLQEMEAVLFSVAGIVGEHLARAKDRIQQGRDEIAKFVEQQPAELREVAQQAADDAQGKFDTLEQTVDDKQNAIIDSLAQQYVEQLQALDSELEAMKEAEKGLLAKAGDLITGVIQTITELKDLLLNTLQRAAGAVMKILEDPIGFLGNLLSAVGQGLRQFVGNIGTHLQQGLISWLTGTLAAGGIQLPANFDLAGIFSMVMQILGLTYAQIRALVVRALGPAGEPVIGALETAWEVFQVIQSEGLIGLWEYVQDQIGDLKAMVLDQIKDMVVTQVIQAGIEWLIGILGGPAGAFIKAVQAIVRVVSWFVENAGRVAALVNSVLDSVMAIANGDIGGAATSIEQSLGRALPMVISFLADLLGLGGIADKVQGIIKRVQAPIQKAIDWLVQKAVALGKKLWAKIKGAGKRGGKDTDADAKNEDDNQGDDAEKDKRWEAGISAVQTLPTQSPEEIKQSLGGIRSKYGFDELAPIGGQKSWTVKAIMRTPRQDEINVPKTEGPDFKPIIGKLNQAVVMFTEWSNRGTSTVARQMLRELDTARTEAQELDADQERGVPLAQLEVRKQALATRLRNIQTLDPEYALISVGEMSVTIVNTRRQMPVVMLPPWIALEDDWRPEYQRQLQDQQDGLNCMTCDQWQQNRTRYVAEGRSAAGTRMQRRFQRRMGRPTNTAAPHNPDQGPGGFPDPTGMPADGAVNSHIGSQWPSRLPIIDAAVNAIEPAARLVTQMNVQLEVA